MPRSPDSFTTLTARELADYLKQFVGQPTGTFAEVYISETSLTDEIMISAVTGTVDDPAAALDRLFATSTRLSELQSLRPADPGPLGGTARCGTDDEAMTWTSTICAWADTGSIGVLSIQSLDHEDRRDEFAILRGQVQKVATVDAQ